MREKHNFECAGHRRCFSDACESMCPAHTLAAYGLIQAAGQAGSFTALYSVPELVQRLGSVDHVYLISLGMSCTALLALGIARILEKTAYGRKPIKPATEPSAAKVHDAVLALAVGGHFAADDSTGTKGASLLAHDHESKGATGGGAGGALHAEDDNEPEEVDTDIISAELRGVLSDNLAWANRIPGLFNFLMFLGIGHMFSLKWRFYCVLGGIIAYSRCADCCIRHCTGCSWWRVRKACVPGRGHHMQNPPLYRT